MKKLAVKPIPVSSIDHPLPPAEVLPRHEFSMGFIAPKGSGKTTCLIRLLDFYRGYFHSIIVFSPTVKNDEKWEWVKKQKLLSKNTKLQTWIIEMKNKQSRDNQGGLVHRQEEDFSDFDKYLTKEDFDGTVPETCFLEDYDEDTLGDIMNEQKTLIHLLKAHGKTKHWANRLLIIFDDLVGSSLFSGKKNNPFKMLNANHRHYSASLLMVSQAYKEIPKTVRTQFSCLIVFEIPNENEIKVIYEENPVGYKMPQWMQIYNYAVEGDHNFLFINYQKPKKLRMMKNFQEILFIK
jgi:hypothetical protein